VNLNLKKGVNLPNTKYRCLQMTEKDIADAILLSDKSRLDCLIFVKTPQILKDLQDLIAEHAEYKIQLLPKSKCQKL
jgi:pyruvate kinase